jgi:hypothetical protein
MEVFVNEGVPHTLNQKGRSSMISLLPERCVETVEQYEEQIPAIACTYQAGALALVRRTESWRLSSEFRLEAITGVTAQHSRGLDAPVQRRRRDDGGPGGECRLLSVQDRLAIICNFLMGNNAGEPDVGGCLYSPVAA